MFDDDLLAEGKDRGKYYIVWYGYNQEKGGNKEKEGNSL